MSDKPITVTSPLLPPLEEFVPYLQKIWDNKWLTNNGEMHQELERQLFTYTETKDELICLILTTY